MRNFKNKKSIEFYESVTAHKEIVRNLMYNLSDLIRSRGENHDNSKIEDPEFDLWVEHFIPEEKRDPEDGNFQETKKLLEEVITIHHRKNRHHPEFHGSTGLKGTTLVDLIETLCDWIATTTKQDKGNLRVTIEMMRDKYKFSKELEQVFLNTLDLLDTIKDIRGEK